MNNMMINSEKIDFRNAFFDKMYEIAIEKDDLVFLTGDISAHSLPKFSERFPSRFYNAGIAEQNMIATAAGLAMDNKKVFTYSMIPFITMRCFEHIKVDICSMNLPVTLIGEGSGLSYNNDGPTAHGTIDIALMRILPELTIFNPCDPISTASIATLSYENSGPTYVRLDKSKQEAIYDINQNFEIGLNLFERGNDLCIISTGIMVHKALELSTMLRESRVNASVIDLYRLKPLNNNVIVDYISQFKRIVTLEENCKQYL
jgi:transketolase